MISVYKARIADKLLARKLAGKGAILIEGPKWCGQTQSWTFAPWGKAETD